MINFFNLSTIEEKRKESLNNISYLLEIKDKVIQK